jgi:hypothetical protein
MTGGALNRALGAVIAEQLRTRYCRCGNHHAPIGGGYKPPGRTPWKCEHCCQRAEAATGRKHPRNDK